MGFGDSFKAGKRARAATRPATQIWAFVALVLGALSVVATPASATVIDPERMSKTVVLHSEGIDKTADQVNAEIGASGQRLTDIDVRSASPLRFDYAAVTNFGAGGNLYEGPYGRDWRWVFGLSQSELSDRFPADIWRIIDLEPYVVSGQWRYAAVLVRNAGESEKTWRWEINQTPAEIRQLELANQARVVDIDPMESATRVRPATRSVVMVAREGPDQIDSQLFFDSSRSDLLTTLRRQRLRPIDVEPRGPTGSTYDVIAVPAGDTKWRWDVQTPTDVQNGSPSAERPYDLDYVEGQFSSSYSVLSVNPPQTVGDPDESQRILDLFEHYFPGGEYEFYAKRVGGKAVSGYGIDAVHEPASAVKALAMLYALKRVEARAITLRSPVQWIDYGTPCTPGQTTTLRNALVPMMQQSNNSATHGVVAHFGNSKINNYAQGRGWESMRIRGCGLESGRSDWSSRDAVDLYEQIFDGSALSKPESVDAVRSIMSPVLPSAEALAMGAVDFYRQPFSDETATSEGYDYLVKNSSGVWKGGSLGTCLPAPADCDVGHFVTRTYAGTLSLPFKNLNGPGEEMRTYAFEWTVEDYLPCSFKEVGESTADYFARCPEAKLLEAGYKAMTAELARAPIRQAARRYEASFGAP